MHLLFFHKEPEKHCTLDQWIRGTMADSFRQALQLSAYSCIWADCLQAATLQSIQNYKLSIAKADGTCSSNHSQETVKL